MIKLFKYEGFRVVISEEALLLKPFKIIWNRDRTQYKEKALMELAFIYFYSDPRSDYQMYIDKDERIDKIKEGEGLPSNWKIDKQLNEAIEFYESFKPASALLLDDTRLAVDKLRTSIKNKDFNELEVKELKDITALIKLVAGLIKDLDEAERALNSEIISNSRMRGGGEKTIMDDTMDI